MDQEELNTFLKTIDTAVEHKNMYALVAQACVELMRIANAQEALVKLATQDLEAQVAEAVESRAEEKAAELDANRTQRSYIGRKKT